MADVVKKLSNLTYGKILLWKTGRFVETYGAVGSCGKVLEAQLDNDDDKEFDSGF